jgi:hypothetical protein
MCGELVSGPRSEAGSAEDKEGANAEKEIDTLVLSISKNEQLFVFGVLTL